MRTQQTNASAQAAGNQPTDSSVASAPQVNRPVQTVRSGAIGASIWENTNRNGEQKIGITFSRSWKSQDGDTGYSHTFYAGNRDDLHKAIDQACDAAQELEQAVKQRIEQLSSKVDQ